MSEASLDYILETIRNMKLDLEDLQADVNNIRITYKKKEIPDITYEDYYGYTDDSESSDDVTSNEVTATDEDTGTDRDEESEDNGEEEDWDEKEYNRRILGE